MLLRIHWYSKNVTLANKKHKNVSKFITGSLETHMFPGTPIFTSWCQWKFGNGRGTLFSLSHSFIIFHPHYHCTRHKLRTTTNVGHNVIFPPAFSFHAPPVWGWGINSETWSQVLSILPGKDPHFYSETVPWIWSCWLWNYFRWRLLSLWLGRWIHKMNREKLLLVTTEERK